ncbi:MAG: ABC transporter ATP-binding protein [Candidatus Desulforudis sp.]|nr:ABC transporter ATP-binding protein [Desulforudis sp.]
MLQVSDLTVVVDRKPILKDINLEINPGETHVLFGPNGSGKSTLLGALMGFDRYEVVKGRIYFKGEDITDLPVHERARRGLALSFQRPPTIRGLSMRDMISICSGGRDDVNGLASRLNFEQFLERDVNHGFSGGELKRSELLQLLAQDPDLVLLDEPESGVDIVNIALIGRTINQLLQRDLDIANHRPPKQKREERRKSGLVITHIGHILNYVNADVGHVLFEGRLSCRGNPRELFNCIQKLGYGECIRCAL